MEKAVHLAVTPVFLKERVTRIEKMGFTKQKWVMFCEVMMKQGYSLLLYEAKLTVSKYVTVRYGKKSFKVRFSNHKPNERRELKGDCDFFVGHTNTGIRTTHDAIRATLEFFNKKQVQNVS